METTAKEQQQDEEEQSPGPFFINLINFRFPFFFFFSSFALRIQSLGAVVIIRDFSIIPLPKPFLLIFWNHPTTKQAVLILCVEGFLNPQKLSSSSLCPLLLLQKSARRVELLVITDARTLQLNICFC